MDPAGKYRLCLRVMGMGDVNSCDLAQGIHETILRNGTCFSDSSCLHVKSKSFNASLMMSVAYTALECAGACSQLDELDAV